MRLLSARPRSTTGAQPAVDDNEFFACPYGDGAYVYWYSGEGYTETIWHIYNRLTGGTFTEKSTGNCPNSECLWYSQYGNGYPNDQICEVYVYNAYEAKIDYGSCY